MEYSNNFLDILFNDKKIININKPPKGDHTPFPESQRTLIFSTPLNTTAEKELLTNILAACQLKISEYLIVQEQTSYANFNANHNIKDVLIFGVPEQNLGIPVHFPYNIRFSFNERIVIKTGSVAEIMANKQLKNDLWQNALKPRFLSAT